MCLLHRLFFQFRLFFLFSSFGSSRSFSLIICFLSVLRSWSVYSTVLTYDTTRHDAREVFFAPFVRFALDHFHLSFGLSPLNSSACLLFFSFYFLVLRPDSISRPSLPSFYRRRLRTVTYVCLASLRAVDDSLVGWNIYH